MKGSLNKKTLIIKLQKQKGFYFPQTSKIHSTKISTLNIHIQVSLAANVKAINIFLNQFEYSINKPKPKKNHYG